MPRATVRFSDEDWHLVQQWAGAAGVATGALIRECVMRCGPQVALAHMDGDVAMRMRNRALMEAPEEPEPLEAPQIDQAALVEAVRRAMR